MALGGRDPERGSGENPPKMLTQQHPDQLQTDLSLWRAEFEGVLHVPAGNKTRLGG